MKIDRTLVPGDHLDEVPCFEFLYSQGAYGSVWAYAGKVFQITLRTGYTPDPLGTPVGYTTHKEYIELHVCRWNEETGEWVVWNVSDAGTVLYTAKDGDIDCLPRRADQLRQKMAEIAPEALIEGLKIAYALTEAKAFKLEDFQATPEPCIECSTFGSCPKHRAKYVLTDAF